MTNPIIRVSHLTYRYPSAKRAVIDDLSFTIARGETVALMGVNGSGKSTLVRMLCALTAPTAGSIEVSGGLDRQARSQRAPEVGESQAISAIAPACGLRDAASRASAVR